VGDRTGKARAALNCSNPAAGAVADSFHAEIGAVTPALTVFFQVNRVTVLGQRSDKFFRKDHFNHRRVFEDAKIADPMVLDNPVTITANFH